VVDAAFELAAVKDVGTAEDVVWCLLLSVNVVLPFVCILCVYERERERERMREGESKREKKID
jgi:hypothetical protein